MRRRAPQTSDDDNDASKGTEGVVPAPAPPSSTETVARQRASSDPRLEASDGDEVRVCGCVGV